MASHSSFGIALRQFFASAGAPSQVELSDLALVHQFAAERNERAFASLLRRHGPMVYGVGRRVLRHSEDAEDVFQAAFLLLARKAASIRKGESVGSWLHGVSYHLAIRLAAQRMGRKRHEREAAAMHSREHGDESVLPELENALDEALQQLPEIYRQALVTCYLEGKSHEEAARILACPVATLRSRLARGRQRLHSILARKGVALSAAALGGALSTHAADAAKMLPLLRTTLEASLQFAAGKGAGAVVSTSVASLVEGGLDALLAAKTKIGVAVLLGFGILAGSAGTMGSWVFANWSSAETRPEKPSPVAQAQPVANRTLTDIYGDKLPEPAVKRLGTVRFRHGEHIESVAYSPDGKWIASGADDHTVRIWDRVTGKQLLRFDGHSDDVHFVKFTPDGKFIISSSGLHSLGHPGAQKDPCTLKWEAVTGKLVGRFPANRWNREMAALALSPDGTTLAACLSPELYISDVTNGRLLRTFAVDDGIVMKVSFSPDGQHLAMIADGQGVALIDVGTGKQIWLNSDHIKDPSTFEPTVYGLAFSPDGRRLVECASRNGPARVLNSATGEEVCRIDNRGGPLVFSRDGKQVMGAIGIWDAATGTQVRDLSPKAIWKYELALSPDGKQLVDAGSSALQFWDVATGKGIAQPAASLGPISQIQLAPDRKSMVTFSMFDPEAGVRLWDLQTCRQLSAFPGRTHNPVALSPALDLLAFGTYWKEGVSLRHIGDWAPKQSLPGESLPGIAARLSTLTFTQNGRRLIATSVKSAFNGGPILMWDVKAGKEPVTLGSLEIAKGSGARCAAISPDDRYFASGGWDNIIRLWDIAGRKEVRQFVEQKGNICAVCFSPDGKYVTAVSGALPPNRAGLNSKGSDSHIRIWEVATGRVVRTIEGPENGSWSVAWSPDGATIASGGEDGLIRLWESATGRQRACLTGHDGPVTSLTFTPDGRQLFSGSADTTVLVWDLAGLGSLSK